MRRDRLYRHRAIGAQEFAQREVPGAPVQAPTYPDDLRTQEKLLRAQRTDVPPLQSARVLSVWPGARPVNARDFYASGSAFVDDAYVFTKTGSVTFVVPDGMVCVLTHYRYAFGPLFDNLDDSLFDGSLKIDNVVVPDFTLLQHGQAVFDYQPTYALASQGQSVVLSVVASGAAYTAGIANFRAELYGQLLLASGRPVVYEPGNDTRR